MRQIIHWDEARCLNCKTRFDLPTLRERKDYIVGLCPHCGGKLVTIKEKR